MDTTFLLPLLLILLSVTAVATIASYTTVFATYWFELRNHRKSPDPTAP
ncbi:hypothetical protein [Nocardia callitridis]|uniref:Uncharacterized protein n=1 Tax=Nocardia callitridis TaxID=648753 RepID=A0ABP9KSC0_9NOCA